jgi:hypothetical protein
MIRTQYLGGQKTTTRSVCHNYFGEDATYETNIDCALAGQSDFIRLHAYADTNTCTQRDTAAHSYHHANEHRYPYQHAHGDSHCYTNEHSHKHTYPNTLSNIYKSPGTYPNTSQRYSIFNHTFFP